MFVMWEFPNRVCVSECGEKVRHMKQCKPPFSWVGVCCEEVSGHMGVMQSHPSVWWVV